MKKTLFASLVICIAVYVIVLGGFGLGIGGQSHDNSEIHAYLNQRQVWVDQIIAEMNKPESDMHFIGQRCQAIAEIECPAEASEIYHWTSVQCVAMLQIENCGDNVECVMAQIEILNRAADHLKALKEDYKWELSLASYTH